MEIDAGQLSVQFEGQVIQTLALTMPVLGIGRSPDSDLSLSHPLVSRNHAELRMGDQGPVLTDLNSANGTYIGEQRLLPNQPHVLIDGMTVRIGPFRLTYQAARNKAQASATPDEEQPVMAIIPDAPTEAMLQPFASQAVQQQRAKGQPGHLTEQSESIYRRFLPDIFQENDFLRRFLLIFQDIWEPLEQRQDHIQMYFDPATCPTAFLPWLASWLDLPLHEHWPEARRRHLLAQAMELYRWRGTSYGLIRMVEVCSGLTPIITENPLEPFVFHIKISLPPGTEKTEMVDKALIEDLIQTHKPAYAGYILEVIT